MNQSACPYDPCHLAEADVRFQTGQVGGSEGGEGRQLPETADRTVKPPVLCYVTCLIEIDVGVSFHLPHGQLVDVHAAWGRVGDDEIGFGTGWKGC